MGKNRMFHNNQHSVSMIVGDEEDNYELKKSNPMILPLEDPHLTSLSIANVGRYAFTAKNSVTTRKSPFLPRLKNFKRVVDKVDLNPSPNTSIEVKSSGKKHPLQSFRFLNRNKDVKTNMNSLRASRKY